MKIIKRIVDFVEETVPALLLLTIFISFLLGVFSRYVLKSSIMWTQEMSLYPYVWLVFLGACSCDRDRSNISFTIVHDMVPEKVKKVFHLIGSIMIVTALIVLIPSAVDFYIYYMNRPTAIMKIPLGICYFSFAIYQVFTIIRYLYRIVESILELAGKKGKEAGN